MDTKGNLYGTTQVGGESGEYCNEYGCGVVYKLSPPTTEGNPWTETALHSFTGGNDGGNPFAGLITDGKGNGYGTAFEGGKNNGGVVFRIDRSGKEAVLYNFCSVVDDYGNCDDGTEPRATPILDAAGNLYGTTYGGGETEGDFGVGTVYKVTPGGKETVLYSFQFSPDGAYPSASLIQDAQGNFYSTTSSGGRGPCNNGGCGIVFQLQPNGTETILYSFSGGNDGALPLDGTLLRDDWGNLYGTTSGGGLGYGTIFKVTPLGIETVLHRFAGGTGGAFPSVGLTPDDEGHFYGTTSGGDSNAYGYGTVYEISQ